MKRDLRGMGGGQGMKKQPPGKEKQPAREQASAPVMRDVNDAIEHYGGRSDAELMNELINFRRQGAIDDAKLAEVYQRLSPMLNDAQKKRLETVLGTLQKN